MVARYIIYERYIYVLLFEWKNYKSKQKFQK